MYSERELNVQRLLESRAIYPSIVGIGRADDVVFAWIRRRNTYVKLEGHGESDEEAVDDIERQFRL